MTECHAHRPPAAVRDAPDRTLRPIAWRTECSFSPRDHFVDDEMLVCEKVRVALLESPEVFHRANVSAWWIGGLGVSTGYAHQHHAGQAARGNQRVDIRCD